MRVGRQPVRVPEPGAVQFVTDAARVGEPRLVHPALQVAAQRCLRFGGQVVTGLLQHHLPDQHQLTELVVGEVEVVSDPGAHPGIGAEELIHPVLVARQDHHELVALVLHHLEQDADRLLPEVPGVGDVEQVVRLVDEQHPAHGLFQHPLRPRRGLPDVFAHEVVAHGVHQVSPLQVAQPVQHVGHPQRHRGLAGTRCPGEAHVQVRPGRLQAEPLPGPVHQQQRGDLQNVLLHRDQADQFAVQGSQDVVDPRRPALLGQRDGGVGAQLTTLAIAERSQPRAGRRPAEPRRFPGTRRPPSGRRVHHGQGFRAAEMTACMHQLSRIRSVSGARPFPACGYSAPWRMISGGVRRCRVVLRLRR